jgi:hypothetical protein
LDAYATHADDSIISKDSGTARRPAVRADQVQQEDQEFKYREKPRLVPTVEATKMDAAAIGGSWLLPIDNSSWELGNLCTYFLLLLMCVVQIERQNWSSM